MSAGEFIRNLSLVVAAMAVISAIEIAVPLFPRGTPTQGRRLANFGLMAMTFLINWGSTSAAVVLTFFPGPGVLERLGLPFVWQIVVSAVVIDFFFGYLAHVTMHHIPVLWRAHAVHHSDPFVDVTTTYRTHPIESVWRSLFMLVPVWVLGTPPAALVIYRLLSAINALFEHANVRVRPALDRTLSLVWVTPNMHKIHHSRERRETNSNYGNLFALYDRLFRTFTPTIRASSVVYGLDGTDPAAVRSFPGLLAMRVAERDDARDARARRKAPPATIAES